MNPWVFLYKKLQKCEKNNKFNCKNVIKMQKKGCKSVIKH